MILYGLALVAVLLGVLIALVVDRRLREARRKREQWLMDQSEAQKVARELRRIGCSKDADRIEARLGSRSQHRSSAAPAPAPCPTTQPHHYLPGSIYADSRSDRSDCGGSSWSSSSDSGSSSCDSSSSSGGGGE